jgi:hypothetical protein
VLEAVTVYRTEDGQYVLLCGQRRTVTAAEVGAPTGLIPARVPPARRRRPDRGTDGREHPPRRDARDRDRRGRRAVGPVGVSAAGYPPAAARSHLTWGLGRLILTRGDPDLTAITDDLYAAGSETRQFGAREDFLDLRRALYPAADRVSPRTQEPLSYARTGPNCRRCTCCCSTSARSPSRPPSGHCVARPGPTGCCPNPCAPTIREAVERYLRIRLEARFDRPQTVGLAREGLCRLVRWLTREHPDVTTLAQVDRSLMEEYLRCLPGCPGKHTGEPLAVTTEGEPHARGRPRSSGVQRPGGPAMP